MNYRLTTRKKTWFHSPIVAVVLIIAIILAGVSVVRAFSKQREAAALRDQYQRSLAEMNQRESELNQKITSLSTDRGLEAEIRERYRVSKPGEELILVVNNGTPDETKPLTFLMKVRMFLGI